MTWFAWMRRTRERTPRPAAASTAQALDHLLGEISRNLRALKIAARAGRPVTRQFRGKVELLLLELQEALRQCDEELRDKYENRAARILLEAALAGIILPPP